MVASRLARGRDRRAPLRPRSALQRVSVVVPARDEEGRLAPCLEALREDPSLLEVVVVDDRSSDGTAALARSLGARVVPGTEPPPGWVGKPWALQQGLDAARGAVVVCLDADTRPRPGLAGALAKALEEADLVSAGPRFHCATPAERWLHPSFLASLVYRLGVSSSVQPPRPGRVLANGQCFAFRRAALAAAGGFRAAASHMTDDVALARHLARRGWRIAFLDAPDLLEVEMHSSGSELWREWGRSIALADVTPRPALAVDVATVWLTMALPVVRTAAGRPRPLDPPLLALRVALLAALRGSYARRGRAFWLSPLADPATAVRLALSALRPARSWRGRDYPRS